MEKALIFSPKPGATPDEVMEILRLFVFQTYPPELKTKENMMRIFNQFSDGAKRHFKIKDIQ